MKEIKIAAALALLAVAGSPTAIEAAVSPPRARKRRRSIGCAAWP